MSLRVASIQLNPKLGEVTANAKHALEIVSKIFRESTTTNGTATGCSTAAAAGSKNPDLFILPELALTGYNFTSPKHIKPYLENFNEGLSNGGNFQNCPSIDWAVKVSKQFNCFTVIGYPEIYNSKAKHNPDEDVEKSGLLKKKSTMESLKEAALSAFSGSAEKVKESGGKEKAATRSSETKESKDEVISGTIYNSACLISPVGSVIFNYRKSFLYETDEVWGAQENPNGFETFHLNLNKQYYTELAKLQQDHIDLANIEAAQFYKQAAKVKEEDNTHEHIQKLNEKYQQLFIKTSIGICMDLSPYKFEAPFYDFEYTSFCFSNDVRLVLFPMAWLSSASPSTKYSEKSEEQTRATKATYLQKRFFPEDTGTTAITTSDASANVVYNDSHAVNDSLSRNNIREIETYDPDSVDMSNVEYWILRSVPLFNSFFKLETELPFNDKTRYIIFCNRIGLETDVLYAGSSSIVKFNKRNPIDVLRQSSDMQDPELLKFAKGDSLNPSVELVASLPTGREGALIRDISFD